MSVLRYPLHQFMSLLWTVFLQLGFEFNKLLSKSINHNVSIYFVLMYVDDKKQKWMFMIPNKMNNWFMIGSDAEIISDNIQWCQLVRCQTGSRSVITWSHGGSISGSRQDSTLTLKIWCEQARDWSKSSIILKSLCSMDCEQYFFQKMFNRTISF